MNRHDGIELVLGTGNPHKRQEIAALLKGAPVRVLSLADFPEIPEPVENGRTFESNAAKKASYYSRKWGRLTLADDSGLMVDALNGRPGVYSARFAGEGCTYDDNNRKLLGLLSHKSPSQRTARFVCSMVLYNAGRRVGSVKGECHGKIALEVAGGGGFGYDPLFIPRGFSKTFAELSPRTKNRISHRGKALQAAKRLLLEYLKRRKSVQASR